MKILFKKSLNSLNMILTLRVFSQFKINVLDFSHLGNLKSYSIKMSFESNTSIINNVILDMQTWLVAYIRKLLKQYIFKTLFSRPCN